MTTVSLCETFVSIQGESSYAGLPCFFIRLAGCNLRCVYCDTRHAYSPGHETPIADLVDEYLAGGTRLVEITGGEPLLQEGLPALATALRDVPDARVLVETNGSRDISVVPDGVVAVMDVKSPGSGVADALDMRNLDRLRPADEVKFVLCDRADYEWARAFVSDRNLASRCSAVLFAPAFRLLEPGLLAGWMIEDGVEARLQLQIHKIIGAR